MKKMIGIIVMLCIVLVFIGCASSAGKTPQANERKIPASFPDFAKKAIKNAPDDVLIGIGTAKLASLSQSRTVAATRARAEISRQMNTIVQDMVRDFQASSEIDIDSALAFQENITVALSKSTLIGSAVVEEDRDSEGNWWTIVMMGKTDVATEISQAQAAAKLAIPAMASFSAEERMNAAFDRLYAQELQASDR